MAFAQKFLLPDLAAPLQDSWDGHSVVPGRTMCARHWGCPGGSGDGFTTGNHHGNTLEKW